MKKILLLMTLGMALCFADNMDLFNQAKQVGVQNQFQLNLNSGSTIDSYGQTNKFESGVANGAHNGNANAQERYNNTYGSGSTQANPNYLSNEGTKEITNCQSKSDPRCTTLNKYGDKDTQAKLQSYAQGFSQEYYISVKPDPTNSSCSTVTRQVQESQVSSCITSAKIQYSCNSNLSINLNYHECDPTNGSCAAYSGNSSCTLTRPYIAPACTSYQAYANIGTCVVYAISCNAPSTFRTPGCRDSGGRQYQCGTCSTGGDVGDHNGCWGQTCTNWTQLQLAQYACRVSSYSDGCTGFK